MILFLLLSYTLFFVLLSLNKIIKANFIIYIFVLCVFLIPIDIFFLNIDQKLKILFISNKFLLILYTLCKFFSFVILYQLPSRAITSALLFNINDKIEINKFSEKFNSEYILFPRLSNFQNKKFIKIEGQKINIYKKTKILAIVIIFFRKIYKVDIYNR